MNEITGETDLNLPRETQVEKHWLSDARRCPSDHWDERPQSEVSLLVIHAIALPPRTWGGPWVEAFFSGQLPAQAHPYFQSLAQVRVSAHLFIRRTGEVIQFVPFDKRAWHAGVSNFQGRQACNDFSIGIELEGADDQPYTSLQYQHLIRVTQALMLAYPDINPQRICGHSDIAPGRKQDPGDFFDWQVYLAAL